RASSGRVREASPAAGGLIYTQATQEIDHFDGPCRRLGPLVPRLRARAFDGLLEGVHGEDAEQHRHARFEGGLLEPGGDAGGDVLVVPRGPADDGAEGDDGVVAPARGQRLRDERDLEGARAPRDVHPVGADTVAGEGVEGALEEAPRDGVVEPAADDGEAGVLGRDEGAFVGGHNGSVGAAGSYEGTERGKGRTGERGRGGTIPDRPLSPSTVHRPPSTVHRPPSTAWTASGAPGAASTSP